MEIIQVYIFVLAIAIGVISMLVYSRKMMKKIFVIKGYQLHHSMYALLSFLIAFLLDMGQVSETSAYFFIGFGIGVLIQHSIGEGLVFMSKQPKFKNRFGIVKI